MSERMDLLVSDTSFATMATSLKSLFALSVLAIPAIAIIATIATVSSQNRQPYRNQTQPVRQEDALQADLTKRLTITLDRETTNWFKPQTGEEGKTGGTKWISLVEETLQQHAVGEGKQ